MRPGRNISITELSKRLNIHRHTLRRRMQENNITDKFSNITNDNLDLIMRAFCQVYPNSGIRYVIGFLRKHGLRIQRHRVIASLLRIDRLGQTLRRRAHEKTRRKPYHVSRPNALWHIDGHHKLIAWGIVIHGCIDGYSRTVCSFVFC